MIVKGKINQTLKKLEKKYSDALCSPDPYEAKLYAKLALIEYGGWLEESLDLIARRSIKGRISGAIYQQMLVNIIKNTSGFKYKDHFRQMLKSILGLSQLEKLEAHLNNSYGIDHFENQLSSFWGARCDAAHRSIYGTTETYDSPSVMINNVNAVYPVLKDLYGYVCKIK